MNGNNIKISEKIVHLENDFTDLYLRDSFIKVEVTENGHATKTFLASKRKQILTIPDNTKIIHELIPKSKSEWIEKHTEITKIDNNKPSSKIRKKDLMSMVETRKDKLINSRTECYVKKNKTIYTLLDGSKRIYEIYPEKDNKMIFEETIEETET